MANENNLPPVGAPTPAPFPGGISQSGQPVDRPVSMPSPGGFPPPPPAPFGVSPFSASPVGMPPKPVGSSVPPPPPPEVGIRTMASDIKSMQSSGGAGAVPKTFKPEDFSTEPVFKPSAMPSVVPRGAVSPAPNISGVKVIPPKHERKALFITLGIVIFLVLAGLVTYYYIMPMFYITPAPVVETPAPIPTPTPTPTPVGITTHATYFVGPTTSTSQVALDLSLSLLQSALATASSNSQSAGTFKDVSFTLTGEPWTAQDFLGITLPSIDKTFAANTFEQDMTAFVYYDKNGGWPGYVLKLQSGADPAAVKGVIDPAIEASPLAFFPTNPGTPAKTGFADGALSDAAKTPVRFLTYSKKGAALEYAFYNGYLVISTSYQGAIESVNRLPAPAAAAPASGQ